MFDRFFGIAMLLELRRDVDVTVVFTNCANKAGICIIKFFALGLS